MQLAFTLSMPNRSSWNGRWSGEDKPYVLVRSVRDKEQAERIVQQRSFYYDFGDGWGASVAVRAVDTSEAGKLRRKSAGFSGYDWMVDSILRSGRIQT